MKSKPFKPDAFVNNESVMSLDGIDPKQVRFNPVTREIFIGYEDIIELTEVVKPKKKTKTSKKVSHETKTNNNRSSRR